MTRSASLAALLLGSALAGGQTRGPHAAAFEHGTFCRKYRCILQASWQRFGKPYTVYRLGTDDKVELAIYRDAKGDPVGATYSTWTVDDWSADYSRAAEFLLSVFPDAPITKNFVRDVDRSKTQAGQSTQWRGQTLVVLRELERQPSFNLFVRVNLSAGTWRPGEP